MDFDTYCAKAHEALKDKNLLKAYSLLKKIILYEPEDVIWAFYIANVCAKLKKFHEAKNYINLIPLDIPGKNARKLIAKIYLETNQTEKALAICPEEMKNSIIKELESENIGEFKEKVDDLIQWIEDNGGHVGPISVRNFGSKFRGLASNIFIEPSEKILIVPKELIITQETCTTNYTKIFKDKFSSHHSLFALFIMVEKKNPLSPWNKFLSVMPDDCSNFPIFFNSEEISYLNGSSLLKILAKEIICLEQDYSIISSANLLTYEEFLKGRMLVSSRLFSVKAEKDQSGLVPFADFFNHTYKSSLSWGYNFDDNGFTVETQESYDRGMEITIDYGKKSNLKLMMGYGFATEENSEDEYILELHLKKSDSLYEIKSNILGNKTEFHLLATTESNSFNELLGFLRFSYCKDKTFIDKFKKTHNLKNFHFISLQNEILALTKLQKICSSSLSQLSDMFLIFQRKYETSNQKTLNQKNILITLQGEKKVLEWGVSFTTEFLNFFNNPNQYTLNTEPSFEAYIESSIKPNIF